MAMRPLEPPCGPGTRRGPRARRSPVALAALAGLAAGLACPPARAQPEPWRAEPPARHVAPAVVRQVEAGTFFGFTCHARRWTLFVKHMPAGGGVCEDAEACETALDRVRITLDLGDSPARAAEFSLFSNIYYQDGDLTAAEMRRLLTLPVLRLRPEDRLARAWSRETLDLPLDGLAALLERESRRFTCPR